MAWVLLLASAAAVAGTGIITTVLILSHLENWPGMSWWVLWPQVLAASTLTVVSLALRTLRWVFLLRRAETRIPIRDAYIGYLAGFSLLFAPLFLGEIALRAAIHRRRGGVPVLTTVVVNVWDRALDAAALGLIGGVAGLLLVGSASRWSVGSLTLGLASLWPEARRGSLRLLLAVVRPVTRRFDSQDPPHYSRLANSAAWLPALAASVAAWLLPGIGFWLLASVWMPFRLVEAEHAYASSSASSVLAFAPGGVLVAGRQMLTGLTAQGFSDEHAVLTVVGVRLATVGMSILLGGVFVLIHLRTARAGTRSHFDEIAEAYDVQIPEARRLAILERKASLMRGVIQAAGTGPRGLDVGCGQGAYVARMRALGFDVTGIDASRNQVALAGQRVGEQDAVELGSVLDIPAPADTFDFLYVINVLHHLATVEEQRRAFDEMLRVVKPGGLVFLHEINTRNVLFRFYMGYLFPSLNCIDEGVERWLRPDRLPQYTDASVVDTHYFTFLPDFTPRIVARLLGPLERALETSRWRVYSAHYMAVLRKEAGHRR